MPGVPKGKLLLELIADDEVSQEVCEYVAKDLETSYPLVGAVQLRRESVPKSCYVKERGQYNASGIIHFLRLLPPVEQQQQNKGPPNPAPAAHKMEVARAATEGISSLYNDCSGVSPGLPVAAGSRHRLLRRGDGQRKQQAVMRIMLTTKDMFSKDLCFVLGLGVRDVGCVVSTCRLSGAGPPHVAKVARHELGHVAGLPHCREPCLMAYSNSVEEGLFNLLPAYKSLAKGEKFCKHCLGKIDAYKQNRGL